MARTILALVLASLLVSCGDDGTSTDPGPQDDSYAPPLVSAGDVGLDQMVENLEASLEQLKFTEYEELIHADFVFRIDPAGVDVIGRQELSAVEDLESMRRMFDGAHGVEPVVDPVTGLPTGAFTPVPPVQSIAIDLVPDSASDWSELTAGEFSGTRRRVYDIDMIVTYAGSNRIDAIRGKQIFYGIANGESGEWQLRGWEDQGIGSAPARLANDGKTVGALKARFLGGI
jgi:hypothetical protein